MQCTLSEKVRAHVVEAHEQLLRAGLMSPEQCDALRRAPDEAVSVATSCHACAAPVRCSGHGCMVDGLAPRPVALKFRRVTHAYYVTLLVS